MEGEEVVKMCVYLCTWLKDDSYQAIVRTINEMHTRFLAADHYGFKIPATGKNFANCFILF